MSENNNSPSNQEETGRVYPAELSTQSFGRLQVNVTSQNNIPIEDATIRISSVTNPENVIEQLVTNSSGQSQVIEIPAPPQEYSEEPSVEQPYSEYIFLVSAPNFEDVAINGAQILPNVTAVQPISMLPSVAEQGTAQNFVIGPHTLFGDYPPKIAEAEIKPTNETGEIVLSRVVIPEYIVVHDGPPRDSSAQNYYIRYRDYIANVASSEIYATWPEATIYANVLAIMSFTLNRVYTEWYRNQGYSFTITTSTAYDHKFIPNRNIFENIEVLVDNVFANYLSRPNVKQPILTQYCDGRQVQCPNWMTKCQERTK